MRSVAGIRPGPSGRHRSARAAGALILAAVVALVHGLVLGLSSSVGERTAPGRSTLASMQVRQVGLPVAPVRAAVSTAVVPVPVAPRPSPPTATGTRTPMPPSTGAASATEAHESLPLTFAEPVAGPDPTAALPAPPPDGAPTSDEPLPTYATRMPAPARLRYDVRRGPAVGTALLDWQVDGDRYTLQLQAALPDGAQLEQHSQGGFDAAGLAPERLADRRRGRGVQAANFRRQQGRISFSGPRWEYPLVPGVQDRLSWMVQLAAIGRAGGLDERAQVELQVVGSRGATSRWRFQVGPRETVAGPLGRVDAVRLVRQPEHLYDLRIEIWLDPAREFWPVRLRQAQVPGGDAIEWSLSEEPAAPAGT